MRVSSATVKEDLKTQKGSDGPVVSASQEKVLYDEFSALLDSIVAEMATSAEFNVALTESKVLQTPQRAPKIEEPKYTPKGDKPKEAPEPAGRESVSVAEDRVDQPQIEEKVVQAGQLQDNNADNETVADEAVQCEVSENISKEILEGAADETQVAASVVPEFIVQDNKVSEDELAAETGEQSASDPVLESDAATVEVIAVAVTELAQPIVKEATEDKAGPVAEENVELDTAGNLEEQPLTVEEQAAPSYSAVAKPDANTEDADTNPTLLEPVLAEVKTNNDAKTASSKVAGQQDAFTSAVESLNGDLNDAKVVEKLAKELSRDQRLSTANVVDNRMLSAQLQNSAESQAVKEIHSWTQTIRTLIAKPAALDNLANDYSGIKAQLNSGQKSETAKGRSKDLSEPQVARTLEKVQEAVKELARSRDGKSISIRLDPPSLGSVKADVTFRDGVLHARLTADNPQVATILRERSHELQQVLRRAGIEADQVSVSVGGEGNFSDNSNASSGETRTARQWVRAQAHTSDAKQSGIGSPVQQVADHWVA
jgi:flagellar hook-length control protein FliK